VWSNPKLRLESPFPYICSLANSQDGITHASRRNIHDWWILGLFHFNRPQYTDLSIKKLIGLVIAYTIGCNIILVFASCLGMLLQAMYRSTINSWFAVISGLASSLFDYTVRLEFVHTLAPWIFHCLVASIWQYLGPLLRPFGHLLQLCPWVVSVSEPVEQHSVTLWAASCDASSSSDNHHPSRSVAPHNPHCELCQQSSQTSYP
jgi:hypothetical protein